MSDRQRKAAAPTEHEAVAALARLQRSPIVDPGGVTFVYHGAADAVNLRCWIHGLPAAQPFERVGEHDLWVLRVELPENSRIEYKFEVVRDGHEEWILDPLNPLQAADPFGANSVAQGYGYERPEWTLPDPARAARHARGDRARERGARRRRGTSRVYVPARFRRSRRYPLLVVHDGLDYLRYANLQAVLDNLIHRLEIPPLIVALTQSPDRLARVRRPRRPRALRRRGTAARSSRATSRCTRARRRAA